jgi:hypothetical protein
MEFYWFLQAWDYYKHLEIIGKTIILVCLRKRFSLNQTLTKKLK